MRELHTGDALAGYRIDGVVGRGGMGVVYRATHLRLQRVDALKVIAPELADEAEFRHRFERESSLAAQIDHPNVIPIYAAGDEQGLLYIAMRFVDGTDLREVLFREDRIEPARAARIVAAVAAALDSAHHCGLVHRDVKPANVLLARRDGEEHVYLSDFGLAKVVASTDRETRTGMFVGTTDYVSPEQVRGKRPDARSDVYSLGCTLFHMLTGRVPYPAELDWEKLVAHTREPVPSALPLRPDIPSAFDTVISRAMAKQPSDRYQSAGGLGRAALAAAEGRTLAAEPRSVARGEAAPTDPTVQSTQPAGETTGAAVGSKSTLAPAGEAAGATGGLKPTQEMRAEDVQPPTAIQIGPESRVDAQTTERRRPTGARPLRRWLLASAAVVIGALIAVLVIALGGGSDGSQPGAIPVGNSPDGIAIAQGNVWISNAGDGSVTRLDQSSGKALGTINYANHSEGAGPITVWQNSVWVADSDAGSVEELDPLTGKTVGSPITVGGHPGSMIVAGGALWFANYDDDVVSRIQVVNGKQTVSHVHVGTGSKRMAAVNDTVWVANSSDGTLTKVSTAGRVLGSVTVGGHPVAINFANGFLWVANSSNNTVARFDPASGRSIGSPIRVGADPRRIAAGKDSIWVSNSGDGTVTRIASSTGRVLATIRIGGHPSAITVSQGVVWAAAWSELVPRFGGERGTVTRIDESSGKVLRT